MRSVSILFLLVACTALVACASLQVAPKSKIASDSTGCAICVFGLTVVSNKIKEGAKDISKLLAGTCDVFSNDRLKHACQDLMTTFGPEFIKWLLKREEPDWICSKLKLCKSCHLVYDSTQYYSLPREERAKRQMDSDSVHASQLRARWFAGILEAQFITKPFNNMTSGALGKFPNIPPKVDLDKDGFSSAHLCHRGADWRGKDCHDLHSKIHPGAAEDAKSATDGNCNGIYGVDRKKSTSYEAEYCQSYPNDRTLVFFGDSATAGFSIPVEWVSVNLTDLIPGLVNELDWPMYSYASGWAVETNQRSLYYKFRNLNRCVHRQFINVAVNGATMSSFVGQVADVKFTENWKPVLAFAGYIGNDVCANSLDEMTKPEAFRQSLMDGLAALNAKVPKGSKVILWGLVDGSILFENMHNMTHPIGNGVTYSQFYKFLSCVGMNPCSTWLTDDKSSRDAATKRAFELDAIVEDVVKNYHNKFSNLEIGFLDFEEMLDDGFELLSKEGHPKSELIDPVDGFHPSIKVGHRILADVIFQHLNERYPDFVGQANPNNAAIEARFGDQGGY